MTDTKASRKWLEELVLELRQRNVSGGDTGDAVADVESYCARRRLIALVPVTVQVLGLLVLFPGLFALKDGAAVNLSVYFLLVAITTAGCLIFAGVNLDNLARRPLLGVVVLLLFNAVVLGLTLLEQSTDAPSITLPALVTLLIGSLALVAGSLLGQLRGNEQDPIVKPVGSNRPAVRRGQRITLVINWGLFAGATLFSAGWLVFA